MPSAMTVDTRSVGFTTIASISGDVDLESHLELAEILLPIARSADRLVLDMTSVNFIDSVGLGVLTRVRRALKERGQAIHVVPSRRVLATLKLASLTDVMSIYDDVGAALLPGDAEPA